MPKEKYMVKYNSEGREFIFFKKMFKNLSSKDDHNGQNNSGNNNNSDSFSYGSG